MDIMDIGNADVTRDSPATCKVLLLFRQTTSEMATDLYAVAGMSNAKKYHETHVLQISAWFPLEHRSHQ